MAVLRLHECRSRRGSARACAALESSADAQTRIDDAVKLATLRNSANVFDAANGENNLGVSITVQ